MAVHVATERLLAFHEAVAAFRGNLRRVREEAYSSLLRLIVLSWRDRVGRLLERPGAPSLEDCAPFGTTLLAVLVSPDYTLAFQIGDGAILSVDSTGHAERVLEPDARNFAGETLSLSGPQPWMQARLAVCSPRPGEQLLLVATDGYENSYPTEESFLAVGPDYLTLIREQGFFGLASQVGGFLERVTSGGCGDDVTLGLIYQPPQAAQKTTLGDPRSAAETPDHPASPLVEINQQLENAQECRHGDEAKQEVDRCPAGGGDGEQPASGDPGGAG